MKKTNKITSIISGVIIAIAVIIILLSVLTHIDAPIAIHLFTVQTDSMVPVIRPGSLIFTKSKESYQVGEIITYNSTQSGAKASITHRIIAMYTLDGVTHYQTKGDANEAADVENVTDSDVVGAVIFQIPFLGYVISFTRTPIGFILLLALPAGLIITDEVRVIRREVKKMKDGGKRGAVG